ncbi:MAG: hypothetical protein ACTSQJ_18535 [Promethearchaeota archaeon]
MNKENFVKHLSKAQELMAEEKYKEAIVILEKLKEIEKKGDFNYDLIHKLYQLISNSHSLYNQQVIIKIIQKIAQNNNNLSLRHLLKLLREKENLKLDESILQREIEILILRGKLNSKIEGDNIIFF